MTKEKKYTLEINKGTLKITGDRRDLLGIIETPDGVVFNLKGGLDLHFNDLHMTIDTKARITTPDAKFPQATLIYNLDNYRAPVTVDLT
jgi:hypothetical protein